MIITGNKDNGVAGALAKLYPDAEFISRSTGYDLSTKIDQERLAESVCQHSVFVNCAALYKFNQTTLLNIVYHKCVLEKHNCHIINIGSTTDRVKKGGAWLYNAEKKALRDYSNTLGLNGVWANGPKISYISFGTLDNNQEKHLGRKTLNINTAAEYIKWIVEQPKNLSINELSIDPMQPEYWND
jgi:NADP-dependent 3-hydroxy acid dehydrogenase YdfG|tara:strand:+ start:6486 stop:7040 length:555 start_codon:yes stop_codon:yes gene_type:complete